MKLRQSARTKSARVDRLKLEENLQYSSNANSKISVGTLSLVKTLLSVVSARSSAMFRERPRQGSREIATARGQVGEGTGVDR